MDSWQQVLSVLEQRVNQQSYNTWFKPTQLIKHEGRALYVRVPNAFFQDWLNEHIDVVIGAAKDAGIGEIHLDHADYSEEPEHGRVVGHGR